MQTSAQSGMTHAKQVVLREQPGGSRSARSAAGSHVGSVASTNRSAIAASMSSADLLGDRTDRSTVRSVSGVSGRSAVSARLLQLTAMSRESTGAFKPGPLCFPEATHLSCDFARN
jgi:hypothetical protein